MPDWSGYLRSRETGTRGERASKPNPLFPLSFFFPLTFPVLTFRVSKNGSVSYFPFHRECGDPTLQLSSPSLIETRRIGGVATGQICSLTHYGWHDIWKMGGFLQGRGWLLLFETICSEWSISKIIRIPNWQCSQLHGCHHFMRNELTVSSHLPSCSLPSPISTTAGNNLLVSLFQNSNTSQMHSLFLRFSLEVNTSGRISHLSQTELL